MMKKNDDVQGSISWSTLHAQERQTISDDIKDSDKRTFRDLNVNGLTTPTKERKHVGRNNRTGISLCGGGVRSAVVCMGVLKRLTEAKMLGQFDFLSSVPGRG